MSFWRNSEPSLSFDRTKAGGAGKIEQGACVAATAEFGSTGISGGFLKGAVRLAPSESIPTAQVARDLGVRLSALYNWLGKHRFQHSFIDYVSPMPFER